MPLAAADLAAIVALGKDHPAVGRLLSHYKAAANIRDLVLEQTFIDACWHGLAAAPAHAKLPDKDRQAARGVLEVLHIRLTGKLRDD